MQTQICAGDDAECLARASDSLLRGEIVALPTDTVYGLAAVATNKGAVQRVFDVKGRPPERPLPVFVASVELAAGVAVLGVLGQRLAAAFWPGGLTIVAERAEGFVSAALLGGSTVGVRIPDCAPALSVLRRCGVPLAVTSANRSGSKSLTTAAEVARSLDGLIPLIVDGGRLPGMESTVIDITTRPAQILRPGVIPRTALEAVLGAPVADSRGSL